MFKSLSHRFFYFSIVVLICVCAGNAKAQKQELIDQLKSELDMRPGQDTLHVHLLNKIADTYYHLDFDSVFHYASRALELSKTLNYEPGLAEAYRNVGYVYIPWSRYDTALIYLDSSLMYVPQAGLEPTESEIYKGIGIAYEESGRYNQSIEAYRESLLLKGRANDISGIGKVHNNMGQAFANMGSYDSATHYLMLALSNDDFKRQYNKGASAMLILGTVKLSTGELQEARALFLQALSILELPDQIIKIATLNAYMCKIFLLEQQYDSALHYAHLSRNQFAEINHRSGVAGLTTLIGEAYLTMEKYDSAIVYVEKGIGLKLDLNDVQFVSEYHVRLAQAYKGVGELDKSFSLAHKAVELAQTYQSLVEETRAYQYLHELYAGSGNYKKAYAMQTRHLQLRDSLLNSQKIAEIERLETQFAVKQLESEKKQLVAEQAAKDKVFELDKERQRLLLVAFASGLFAVLIAARIIYISYQNKKRDNEVIKAQKKKLEELISFKEGLTHMIAHDMKNSLNTIIGLSNSYIDTKMHSIGQAGRLMLNLVTNMLDVQRFEEAKVKLVKETMLVNDLFEEAHSQVDLLLKTKSLRFKSYAPQSLEVRVDKDIMTRVLVNLLTNAIKHSSNGRVIILKASANNEGDQPKMTISVIDQGQGIPRDRLPRIFEKYAYARKSSANGSVSTGLGLAFTKLAVEAHEGRVSIISKEDWGTSINLQLPLESEFIDIETLLPTEVVEENKLIIESEKDALIEYADELRMLKVYEVGSLTQIFDRMSKDEFESPWTSDIKAAVYQGDQNTFDELVKMVDS